MTSSDQPGGPSEAKIRATLGSVGRAFFDSFPELREVQLRAIPPIAEGANLLVCSATASGKTEAVIAPLVWRVKKHSQGYRTGGGTKFLAIAPTRALVTDLLKRLDRVLPSFGWSVGAQTSDHQDAKRMPDALVTTPESLDSMLAKGFSRRDGKASGHLLAGVEAVFVDEAHLFDCSVRGDQVLFLLERLRRLRQSAADKGWTHGSQIQICGASATVSAADELAVRMLGQGASALLIAGGRDLSILNRHDKWIPVVSSTSATELFGQITIGASGGEVCRKLVQVFREHLGKKVLLFCPSRAMCDGLGEFLSTELRKQVEAWVGTHHGSLDGDRRRAAETGFAECRGVAVLVATSTLEVGIDIGDVDVVALVGPPPDVPALLQRVGRGGRRGDGTRVIPFAENHEHAAALAGMLVSAATGDFAGGQRFRNWGVFAQQVASYILQNSTKGRPRKSLVELAEAVWPAADTAAVAAEIIDDLLGSGSLVESRSRYFLDGAIIERKDEVPTSAHSNIRAGGSVVPVRNRQSGEIIGHVSGGPTSGFTNIGGRRYEVVGKGENEIVVSTAGPPKPGEAVTVSVKYPTVPFLISQRYCREVARGAGLKEKDAPLIDGVWWHFGGQAIEKLLRLMAPEIFIGIAHKGMALRVTGGASKARTLFAGEDHIADALEEVVASARSRYSRSSFDDFLSDEVFAQVAREALQPRDLLEFLRTRRVFECSSSDAIGGQLALFMD